MEDVAQAERQSKSSADRHFHPGFPFLTSNSEQVMERTAFLCKALGSRPKGRKSLERPFLAVGYGVLSVRPFRLALGRAGFQTKNVAVQGSHRGKAVSVVRCVFVRSRSERSLRGPEKATGATPCDARPLEEKTQLLCQLSYIGSNQRRSVRPVILDQDSSPTFEVPDFLSSAAQRPEADAENCKK